MQPYEISFGDELALKNFNSHVMSSGKQKVSLNGAGLSELINTSVPHNPDF